MVVVEPAGQPHTRPRILQLSGHTLRSVRRVHSCPDALGGLPESLLVLNSDVGENADFEADSESDAVSQSLIASSLYFKLLESLHFLESFRLFNAIRGSV